MSLLQLPSFKEIAPMQENDTDMLFKVELVEPPFFCPHCGAVPAVFNTPPMYYHDFNSERTVEVEELLNYGVDFSTLLAYLERED